MSCLGHGLTIEPSTNYLKKKKVSIETKALKHRRQCKYRRVPVHGKAKPMWICGSVLSQQVHTDIDCG